MKNQMKKSKKQNFHKFIIVLASISEKIDDYKDFVNLSLKCHPKFSNPNSTLDYDSK